MKKRQQRSRGFDAARERNAASNVRAGYRQWHLPFQKALCVTLEADDGHYVISPERELTRKPLRIDFLILKKDSGWSIKSKFGKLLKNHTILEYKGATDRLGIEDIYKGLAYVSLYISSGTGDAEQLKKISNAEDVLLMFVCSAYPKKVMEYLEDVFQGETDSGIYHFRIWRTDIIIMVQSRLEGEEYIWLKNLSLRVNTAEFDQMARQALERPEDTRRDELIQFIGEANPYLWEESEDMCKIFEEVERRGENRGRQAGIVMGEERGKLQGESRLSSLIQILLKEGRIDEISAATSDANERRNLYSRYGI